MSRVRRTDGWSGVVPASDVDEAFDAMTHRLVNHMATPEGTQVTYGCARVWRPFDVLERQLLALVRPCVSHLVAERGPMIADAPDLTDREMEVLLRVAQGLTNAEVAAQLFVAPGTVKKHLDHIYRKMGVKGRTEAAVRVAQARLRPFA